MKKSRKNKWIPVLMSLSQVLLTGFVVYWLIGQYKGEKENLYKELHYEFLEAQNQAMDSSLHVMLQPLLTDSLGQKDSLNKVGWISTSSTAIFDSLHVDSRYTPDGSVGDAMIKFDIVGADHSPNSKSTSYQITTIPHQEAVLRGVKMIIQMSNDSIAVEGGKHFSSLEVDSVLLLDFASKRLMNIDHSDFNILWYEDSFRFHSNDSGKRIRFHSASSKPKMVYEITNYEPFLFKLIIPQILFGLLLLLLTGSAFIIAYRSLRKQLLLNTLRNEFISNVSHELKTPVSTVKVALESLRNFDLKKDKDVSDEYLRMASLEMDRLDLLIQKILNQSLLESQQVVHNKESSNLLSLTSIVIQSFKPRLQELNGSIELKSELNEALVFMDDLYIQGVLINLLDNAVKYGGDPPKIEINILKERGRTSLSVLDNGKGIDKEYHDKVFERFFRVPTDNKHNVKGYGLGLSFAVQVMQQHGGSIKLETSSSGSCLFTIQFQE